MTQHNIIVDQIPPKIRGYLNAVTLPCRGYKQGEAPPQIRLTRKGFTLDKDNLSEFCALCGWETSQYMPFLYALALAFHYHLGIFACKEFPWSLRTMLGLRNHAVQYRRIRTDEILDLSACTLDLHVGPKGLEFDVHTHISSKGETLWESLHGYYIRGDFGGRDVGPLTEILKPLESVQYESEWDAPTGDGLKFARLFCDLNPIHYSAKLAKALGFKRDFPPTHKGSSPAVSSACPIPANFWKRIRCGWMSPSRQRSITAANSPCRESKPITDIASISSATGRTNLPSLVAFKK